MTRRQNENSLLKTLYIIRSILTWRPTSRWLADHYEVSDRQLKRYIAEARQLGADLRTVRLRDGEYHWQCENAGTLEATGRLARWIELEESRSLTDAHLI